MKTAQDWKKRTLAYRLFGIGEPKQILSAEQCAWRRQESFNRGPVGVWARILGPGASKVMLYICVLGAAYLLASFVMYIAKN